MTSKSTDLVGRRFRVRGLLGSGGTASVYEALDVEAGGLVALKMLHPHLAAAAGARAAFLREAERARRVEHPGIPRVIAVGDDPDDVIWTAWTFAPGTSLAEIVRTGGPLTPARAARVTELVLDALDAVHRAGLVHRDVSASNVLVHRDTAGGISGASVIDFGLADVPGRTTRAGDVLLGDEGERGRGEQQIVGNPSYASPEQLRGDPVGVAGDLYQVGGLLHTALVGEPPFVRPRTEDTVRAHLASVPPTVSVRVPGVSAALDRVVVRALLKHPDDRFASAAEMREALVAATAGVPRSPAPPVRPIAPSSPAPPPATRVLAAPVAHEPVRATRAGASPVLWALLAGAGVLVGALVFALVPRGGPVEARGGEVVPTASAAATAPVGSAPPVATVAPVAEAPPIRIAVPEVTGLSLDEARAILSAIGLDAAAPPLSSDDPRPAGTVLSLTPAPGEQVLPGTVVALTVASGWTAVPDVRGRPADEAQYAVASAGLEIALRRVPTRAVVPGTVMDAEPGAATRVQRGARVTLVVADAASEPSSTSSPSPSPSTATPIPTPRTSP
ncbi:PASTA domain-containing protein [Microbacterium sp. NPDC090007]|uniref:protein kinase domain-containing protein n=1 Tax=Microbacterium sp. NPDC090007 TaxID=3364204 RepID=UPI003800D106